MCLTAKWALIYLLSATDPSSPVGYFETLEQCRVERDNLHEKSNYWDNYACVLLKENPDDHN